MISSSAAIAELPSIRVMVVDDSAVVRGLISRHLEAEPGIAVVATAAHGELALAQLARTAIDLVVLDIEMPVMDGLTTLQEIMVRHPGVRVIMASTLTRRNAEISFKALNLGASDYVAKPESGLGSAEEFKRELVAKIKAVVRRRAAVPPSAAPPRPTPVSPSWAGIVMSPRVAGIWWWTGRGPCRSCGSTRSRPRVSADPRSIRCCVPRPRSSAPACWRRC